MFQCRKRPLFLEIPIRTDNDRQNLHQWTPYKLRMMKNETRQRGKMERKARKTAHFRVKVLKWRGCLIHSDKVGAIKRRPLALRPPNRIQAEFINQIRKIPRRIQRMPTDSFRLTTRRFPGPPLTFRHESVCLTSGQTDGQHGRFIRLTLSE